MFFFAFLFLFFVFALLLFLGVRVGCRVLCLATSVSCGLWSVCVLCPIVVRLMLAWRLVVIWFLVVCAGSLRRRGVWLRCVCVCVLLFVLCVPKGSWRQRVVVHGRS